MDYQLRDNDNRKQSIESTLAEALTCIESKEFSEADSLLTDALMLQDLSEEELIEILKRRSEVRSYQGRGAEALNDLNFIASKKNSSEVSDLISKVKLQMEREGVFQEFTKNSSIHLGSVWYVVSFKWFQKWLSYVQATPADYSSLPFLPLNTHRAKPPGPVENADIIDEIQTKLSSTAVLKKNLIENVNYLLLPSSAYLKLEGRYGSLNPIKRSAIEVSESIFKIEVYLKQVNIAFAQNGLEVKNMHLSRKTTIREIRSQFKTPTRIWKIDLQQMSLEKLSLLAFAQYPVYLEGSALLPDHMSIEDAALMSSHLLMVEKAAAGGQFCFTEDKPDVRKVCGLCQRPAGTWCRCHNIKYCSEKCKKLHLPDHKKVCKRYYPSSLFKCFCVTSNTFSDSDDDPDRSPVRQSCSRSRFGLTGLRNLGNSCFLNTALQCLSHTQPLTDYFLSNAYASDVNTKNPLGTSGKLAYAYSELLDHLWNGLAAAYSPASLKRTLAKIAPQFLGNMQHDTHEMLCYLLDGLHEDLNRVQKKPYFEEEPKGKNEQEVAQIHWQRHLARNQSIIVDLMHGQYKSTIHCPECKAQSTAFEEFNTLSLPIPPKKPQKLAIYFIHADSRLSPCNITLNANFRTLGELRPELCRIFNGKNITFANVSKHTIREVLSDDRDVEKASKYALFAYESEETPGDMCPVEVQVRKASSGNKLCAYPRLVFAGPETTFVNLHMKVFEKFKPFIKCYKDKSGPLCPLYEDLRESPEYTLHVYTGIGQMCPICNSRSCLSCPLPYTSELLGSVLNRNMFTITLRIEKFSFFSGMNVKEMNKCTEENRADSKTESPKIDDCFRLMSQPEKLDSSNSWYCEKCKQHVQGIKTLEIYRAPKILIVHLKRFKNVGFHREKIDDPVVFPLRDLDISEFVIGPEETFVYDLYAISNHVGNLAEGHYTSVCYNESKEQWIEFDDANFEEIGAISATSAYILFYKVKE